MTKRIMDSVEDCYLKRMCKDATEHLLIPLKDGEKITIGRMSDATVSIPTSVMISRQHAMLQQSPDGSWTITDNKSLNGVKINGRTIIPAQPTVLKDNDIVQLGVAPSPDQPPEFVWRFRCRMRIKRFKYDNYDITAVTDEQHSDKIMRCKTLNNDDFKSKFNNCNAKNVRHESLLSCQSDLSLILPKTLSERPTDCKTSCSDNSEHCGSSCAAESDTRLSTEMSRHAQLEDEQREELRKQKEHLEEMTQLLKAKELEQQKLEEELREKALRLEEERQRQQAQLELEQHKRLDELRVSYELKMLEQESSLMEKLNTDRQRLLDERLNVETSLQVEMAKKLEEKDRALGEQLLGEQRRLNEILEEKEEEKRRLEVELTGAKCESERVKAEDVSRARDDIIANLAGLMESELQCGICTEVFVKPTTLNCMHSFCAACIAQWMKIKKVCPACRAPIVTRLRSIVLDSYIDKMTEQLSADMKDKRQKLVNERNAQEASEAAGAKAKADEADAQVAAIIARNQLYLQAAATSGRGRRRSNAAATVARLPAPPAVGSIRATRRATAATRLPAPPIITSATPVPVAGLTAVTLPAPRSWVAQVQVMRAALHASNAALNAARLLAPPMRPECTTAPRLTALPRDYLQSVAAALPVGSTVRLVAPPRAYAVGFMGARRTPYPTSTVHPIVVTGAAARTDATPTPSTSSAAGTLASTSSLVIVSEPPPMDNEVTVISEGEEEEDEEEDASQSQNSSSEHDSDTEDSDEDEEESYFPSNHRRGRSNRPYYGGYGACYKCGQRGHWSNGCPY